MTAQRTRLGIGHALTWVAYGLTAAALTTDALGHDRAPLPLALGAASALVGAALALGVLGAAVPSLLAARGDSRSTARVLLIVSAALATGAVAFAAALALLGEPPHLAVAAVLGLAAGMQIAAIGASATADPALAPRVRPAPTLLAAAVGVALVALAALVPPLGAAAGSATAQAAAPAISVALIVAAVLHIVVIALAITSTSAVGAQAAASALPAARAPLQVFALLAIAAAGLAALSALRPALSAIGADDAQPAGPLALTLAIGALLGPPLAVIAERLRDRAAAASAANDAELARASSIRATAVLATIGGIAALIAPIARPGVLDLVAAAVLGVALAASVAIVEFTRRAGHRLPTGATALLLLAGAAGAGLAALLLQAVPLPDVVLGAALACLVAAIGMWVPQAARQPVS